MALDVTTIDAERTLWNEIGSLGNAIANMAAILVQGYLQSPYDAELQIAMTAAQKSQILARVKTLRDDLKAKILASEIAKL
jgi:hypothetical protein